MKKIVLTVIVSLVAVVAKGQTIAPNTVMCTKDMPVMEMPMGMSYARFIEQVLASSVEIEALGAALEAETKAARVGIGPEDPEAEIAYFVKRNTSFEMNVVQGFEFPSVYVNRSRLARLQSARSGAAYRMEVRQLVGQAQTMYIDAVYYNNLISLLARSLDNAGNFYRTYRKRLADGDGTVLEANKIESMYLSVSAQYRKAVAERDNNLRKMRLLASLPQTFTVTDSVYPAFDVDVEGFVARAVGMDYGLEQAAIDTLIAERQLRLSRSERLPGFKVGYRLSMEAREPSHGVIAGLSIPLWGRAGSVKAAKASQQAARKSMEAKRALLEAELEGVKESYLASVSILDDYRRLLKGRSSVEVLAKALDAGELSMLDYFVELNVWNDTLMTIVESEHEAALAAAFMQLCVTEF